MSRNRMKGMIAAAAILLAARLAGDPDRFSMLLLDDPAIEYEGPVADPVAQLQERIDRGAVKLEHDPTYGYLPAVLKNLQAPVSSQVLVFSKTSFQAARIGPRMPRAIYFSDRVAVGWVRTGDVVEIASLDPRQGAVFYTLDQAPSSTPRFVRRDECLQCHQTASLGVPGFIVRSVVPDSTGMPVSGRKSFLTDHRSPLDQRWGGWYVTGTHGGQRHMGNTVVSNVDDTPGANLTDLIRRFDTGAYLSPHSDIVALMVLEHQARMQNLFIRAGYEARMGAEPARLDELAQTIVSYMLFTDEARIEHVQGTSGFAAEFAMQGPRDHSGRSLREFDLTGRMFRYPCSYLIYSDAFEALPTPVKHRVYRRLWDILTEQDMSPAFAKLPSRDRKAILEILLDTKRNLPAYWQDKNSG